MGAGATGAMSALSVGSAAAKPSKKTEQVAFGEVNARSIGVVPNDANAAASNSQIINEFFASATSGSRLVLPRGRVHIRETIQLVNQLNKNNSLGLRGLGIGATELCKETDGDLVHVVGFFNDLGDLTLNGADKTALHGIQLRAFPQDGVALPTKNNTFHNIRVSRCRVAIRVGHYSELEGDAIATMFSFPSERISDASRVSSARPSNPTLTQRFTPTPTVQSCS